MASGLAAVVALPIFCLCPICCLFYTDINICNIITILMSHPVKMICLKKLSWQITSGEQLEQPLFADAPQLARTCHKYTLSTCLKLNEF